MDRYRCSRSGYGRYAFLYLRVVLFRVLISSQVTLIGEAVFARCLSAIKEERGRASKLIAGPQREPFRGNKNQFVDDLEQALYASKIISYTQGFMLMRESAKEVWLIFLNLIWFPQSPLHQLKWNLNYAGIASMWRGGCIIKVMF
jgi:6-phosphogluconate dehydrogenase